MVVAFHGWRLLLGQYANRVARPLCFALLLSVALVWARQGFAADLITSRAWYEDKAGTLTFEQVQAQEFKSYSGVLSSGIGSGAIWLRLKIDPSLSPRNIQLFADQLVLRVRPSYLDTVTLYDPLQNAERPRVSGDLVPVSQDGYQSLNFNFVLPKGDSARNVFLRVESTSTRMIETNAFTFSELQREDQGLLIASGLYFGVGGLFLLWALITWLVTKDRIVFAFIFSQVCAIWIGLTVFGYVRFLLSDIWPPAFVSQLLSMSVIAAVLAASWFYLRLMTEFKPPSAVIWMYRFLIGATIFSFLLLIFGQHRLAVTINWAAATVLPLLGLVAAFFARGWQEARDHARLLPRHILLWYFSLTLLIMLIAGSAGFGFLSEVSAFNVYAPLTNGMVSGALAVAVLQYRVNLTQKYQNRILTALEVSQKAIEKERESREERDQLLAMLGHELKTPLAAMRMLLGNSIPTPAIVDRIRKSIVEMDSVIERSVQSGRIESKITKAHYVSVDLKKEIQRLVEESREPAAIQLNLGDVGTIRTDYEFFRVIVSNLFDNACKYRADGSSVSVYLQTTPRVLGPEKREPGVELVVENIPGAAGFPDPEKLFTKYYRSPMARRQAGSGLGSYLIWGMIHKLGGTVRYAPTSERVRFVLWHPL